MRGYIHSIPTELGESMNIFKSESIIRDIIFLIALIVIVDTIIERNGEIYERQLKNIYAVHEVDPAFGNKVRQTIKQIDALQEIMPSAELEEGSVEMLASLKKELLDLKDRYETNSPALLALGPIGTTSIILKEAELEQKFLQTLNETGKLIASLKPHRPGNHSGLSSFQPATSIEGALYNNTQALGTLLS